MTCAAVSPVRTAENAAPTSTAVIAAAAVKVKPFTVAALPAARSLNTTVSVDGAPDPAAYVDTGAVPAEPDVVTTVGSADTLSMDTPLMVRPETAAVDVDVEPAMVAVVPVAKPVTLLPKADVTVMLRPSVAFKATAPVVVSKVAVTPVWLVIALTAAAT